MTKGYQITQSKSGENNMNDLRNLLIAATNKLIENGRIKLDHNPVENGNMITELFGRPTTIVWSDVGYEEVRISVWWDCHCGNRPAVTASGWLERLTGFYLQGKGRQHLFDTYVKRSARPIIATLPRITPRGFGSEGKFFV